MMDLKNKKTAILGWGDDTIDCVPWLLEHGAKITVFDENKEVLKEVGAVGEIREKFEGLERFDLIVRNPSVYRFRKEIVDAEKAGIEISSKTKLFFDNCPAKIIGVTGTKGKGTTATLIYEILKAAGKKVVLGGNIGSGVFGELGELGKEDWVVLELSSFQLVDLGKSPHIAVVLMVTSEHLNWHQDIGEYVNAKKNLVLFQKPSDYAVVNKDYPNSVEIGKAAKGKVIWISGKDQYFETKLRGEHNQENVAAAVAVAKILNIPFEETIKNFKGLEHRLEEVAKINGVTYYNDSFSTTPETAIAAIKSFTEPEMLILGGSSKNSDFTELGKTIDTSKNIRLVILVGQEGQKIKGFIHKTKTIDGGKNMAEIVKIAYNTAISGDVVLLTPACASFDMFKSYKDRGQQFKEAVFQLDEKQNR